MRFVLEMDKSYQDTVAFFGAAGKKIADAADDGLAEGVKVTANHVAENFVSGQYLGVRTGDLRKAIDGWHPERFEGVIGITPNSKVDDYAWLLGDNPANQPKTIRPKKAKYLAIPIGENLSASGVAKFISPRDVPDGFFVKTADQLLFGYRKGKTKRAKFRPLFVLKKEVQIYDTGALSDGVEDGLHFITDAMKSRIDRVLN